MSRSNRTIQLPVLSQKEDRTAAPQLFWRSLEELAGSDQFRQSVEREFPVGAEQWDSGVSRRGFLQVMGASLALAGLYGCVKQPVEAIVPYVRPPEEMIPGRPTYFATAMPFNGYGLGTLVESHLGRPTKVEGNPDHPASLGATNVFMQASVLDLYDPQRSQEVLHAGNPSTWNALVSAVAQAMGQPALGIDLRQRDQRSDAATAPARGERETNTATQPTTAAALPAGVARLAILTEAVTSPTLQAQIEELMARGARWYRYQPINRDRARAGAMMAFGRDAQIVYHIDAAKIIVSLDCDFLFELPGSVRYAREFIDGRRVRQGRAEMNRLYFAESSRSMSGAMADHRVALAPEQLAQLAYALAEAVQSPGSDVPTSSTLPEAARRWVTLAARDLLANRGKGLLIAAESQSPEIHALVHALNAALGNVGSTISYIEPLEAAQGVDHVQSLTQLTDDMNSSNISALLILGGNPAYTAPADLKFDEALLSFSKATAPGGFRNLTVHLGAYADETARLCQWHVPQSHYLESWSDVRAYDGTVSIIQPLIAPLYRSRSAHELLAAIANRRDLTGYEIVRQYWRGQSRAGSFVADWEQWLAKGLIPNTAAKPLALNPRPQAGNAAAAGAANGQLTLIFRPDPSLWDGCFANNAWLQELPKPITKLTWDAAAMMSIRTAQSLGVSLPPGWDKVWQADQRVPHAVRGKQDPMVRLNVGGRNLDLPVLVVPGHADGCISVTLGHGQEHGGDNARSGINVYPLRTGGHFWSAPIEQASLIDRQYPLAITQEHQLMQGRDLVKVGTLEQFQRNPAAIVQRQESPLTLYPNYDYSDLPAWAMVIDNNACIGCNACVVACQSENNIPVVGKEQVKRNREMHWLRIDTYFTSETPEEPGTVGTYYEPVPCMHCETAPCELVCPVGATTHSAEGLNEMTYNRCVGTRYCSNNCPYKVRHFNFLQYSDKTTESLKLMRNPDVTVRNRGVMEKCTYCVQRITAARIQAEKDGNRPIRDGEVQTACQGACPTRAISFGNKNDPEAQVTKLRHEPLHFALLEELNTRPRTTYLARLENPRRES